MSAWQSQIPVLRSISLGSAHHACLHGTTDKTALRLDEKNYCSHKSKGRPENGGPTFELVLLFPSLLAATLARKRFLYALFFARLEVEGMTLNLLDNVLLLDLALKASQGVL